jgi:hypothetical protein
MASVQKLKRAVSRSNVLYLAGALSTYVAVSHLAENRQQPRLPKNAAEAFMSIKERGTTPGQNAQPNSHAARILAINNLPSTWLS